MDDPKAIARASNWRLIDQAVANEIRDRCSHGDAEGAHSTADEILCELLGIMGLHETVKAWQAVEKWYA